jgi:hypothetical protein
MGVFENQSYYNKRTFSELTFAQQRDVFLKIRSWVATVPLEVRYNNALYRKTIIKRIEQIAAYACSGHIPAQDYMGYIYKRGFSTFFPENYERALHWNIIAASSGSKLAPQKMKIFLNPAIDMIILSPRWPQIIQYNDLNRQNYFWFLSQFVCDYLYKDLKLSPVGMSKLPLIQTDEQDDGSVIIRYDHIRNESVQKALDELVKQLPAGIPEPEYTGKIGEEFFGEEAKDEDRIDDIPDIDDIANAPESDEDGYNEDYDEEDY